MVECSTMDLRVQRLRLPGDAVEGSIHTHVFCLCTALYFDYLGIYGTVHNVSLIVGVLHRMQRVKKTNSKNQVSTGLLITL